MNLINPPLILIVDDDPQNLRLLNLVLSEAGYAVAVATGAAVCFKALEKRRPDLILCDVIMPDIDGYEVCRRLKALPEYRDIPLIFLSSRIDTEDLLLGFEVGAVDYVTKPFNKSELLARVRTHTELKQARDTILEYTHQLESLNLQLKALDAEKNHFLGIVAHDLKNPLTTILMSAEMVEERAERLKPAAVAEYMQMIQRNATRIRTIIMNLLDVKRIESGKIAVDLKPFDLRDFATRLIETYHENAERKRIRLVLEAPESPVQLISDENIVFQIGDNLLSNALKYSPADRCVFLKLENLGQQVCFSVRDQGPGFTASDKLQLFEKFARLSALPTGGESSTGLGLSIVKRLCELLGGGIACESEPGAGAMFTVTLPVQLAD